MRNVFIRRNFGAYKWNNIEDFLNDENPTEFRRSFSLVGGGLGDDTNAAAEFKAMQLAFYAQDEIQVSDKFKVTAGVRVDIPIFTTNPATSSDFNTETIPLLEAAGHDLQGAKTGKAPKAALMFAPRIGFNYDVKGDQTTQIRGGLGIFTSRVPFVWPGGMYNNNGNSVGEERDRSGDIPFNPDPNTQGPVLSGDTEPSGQIDLYAEDFKYPQVFRTSLAVDQKLPWGLVGTAEVIFTKTINNIFYQNVNLRDANDNLVVGSDGFYVQDPNDGVIGDPNPDWTASLQNDFTYKGISIGATLGYRHGGDIFSKTAVTLLSRGVIDFPYDRLGSYILPGVNPDGNVNTTQIGATDIAFSNWLGQDELEIWDGTTIRLREVRLGYSLSSKMLEKTPFASLSLTVTGSNLWYRAVNFPKAVNFDTNTLSNGVGNNMGLEYFSGPSSKRYGCSIKATF